MRWQMLLFPSGGYLCSDMILFYSCIIFLLLYKVRVGNNLNDYMSKENTNSIKGVFILIVTLCHISPYIERSGYGFEFFGDQLFRQMPVIIGQLVVVMFLFFSGYGVREGIKRKGILYINTMPKRRILVTLLNFDVAILFFLLLNLLLGIKPSLNKVLLSLVCWEDIGNSNWYIFAIILLYMVTYLFYLYSYNKYPKYNGIHLLVVISILTIVLSFVRPDWWYNTMFAFGAGVIFSEKKNMFDSLCKDYFCLLLFGELAIFFLLYYLQFDWRGVKYNVLSVVFAILIVTMMTRVTINNTPLRWCGEKLFPIYIYQRIPMIFVENIDGGKEFICTYPVLYIIFCLIVTFIIAYSYKHWSITLN